MVLHLSFHIGNDTTCDNSRAKKGNCSRNQDYTARLACGKLHVTTCNPHVQKGQLQCSIKAIPPN